MILIRIILFCLIALFVYAMLRAAKRIGQGKSPEKLEQEPVVPCAQCSLHVPRSQAQQHGEQWFCSDQHREQWLQQHPDD